MSQTMTIDERLVALLELDCLKAELSLSHYVKAAWKVLEPTVPLKWNWHHDYICEYLQAAKAGDIKRLIINVCPRSTKSTLASICFPTWLWTEQPSARFLFGSYADELATAHSVLRRNLIESPWYQLRWANRFELRDDENTKSKFSNNHTGTMKAAGIKGAVTGMGGDYIIIDDPHNPKGAESELELASAIQNYDLAWSTRLNDKKTGRIILIMQRLRENDLTGHILTKEAGFTHIKIPTIAEERERRVFPVSGKVVEREAGALLHPDRDGEVEIAQAKVDLGPYGFSGQHQQNPTPAEGGVFTDRMFQFGAVKDSYDYTFITADTAYKEKEENDFQVFTAWGVKGEDLDIIDVYRRQIRAADLEPDVLPFVYRFTGKWGFRFVWIEPKGHGIYLNDAWRMLGIPIPHEDDIKEFYKDRVSDKVVRASNAVPRLANRTITINEKIKDKEILLSEVLGFPKANRDDFTDTVIDGIKVAYNAEASMLDVFRQEMKREQERNHVAQKAR